MIQRCLMLGAGLTPVCRRLKAASSASEQDTVWDTLDCNPAAKPKYLFDLGELEAGRSLPFDDDVKYDEVHAYEVLEHFGRQGDYRGFFSTFRALWWVLRPLGLFMATCPAPDSPWVWGDPGHTRFLHPYAFGYLTREFYGQLGTTMASDYRALVEPRFWKIEYAKADGGLFRLIMRKD